MTLQTRVMAWVATLALVLGAVAPVLAQTARKPSPYEYRPGGDAAAQPAVGPDYLSRIDGREQFMQLARVYNAGTALEMPHLIFVVDRQNASRLTAGACRCADRAPGQGGQGHQAGTGRGGPGYRVGSGGR